jgi:cell division septum initiation protein DivIVA
MADIDSKTLEDFLDRLKETDELYGLTNKTLETYYKNLDKLDKEVKKGIKGYKDQLKAIKELDEALEEVGDTAVDSANKQKLINQRAELAEKMRSQVLKEASGQAAAALGKGLGKFATEGIGKVTRNLQENTGGISLATDILGTAIDAGGSALSGIGQVASSAAPALAVLGKKGQIAGAALSVLGAGLSFVGESGSKLAKFGLEVLSKEVEKTIAAFNQASSAGAMFADGMTGMRNASSDAGLTVKQFSNVIKNNSGDLAQSGLGVAAAAKKVGDVGKIFDRNGGQVRNQLIKLGYSFEEHAELTATVMANMARVGQKGTAEQIATETEKYAEKHLVILFIITIIAWNL